MTKARGLGRRAGGDHVADLDLTVRDDHPRHQPLDQLALLGPWRPIKPLPHTPAKLVQAQSNTGDLGLAVYLRLQLAQLSRPLASGCRFAEVRNLPRPAP